jgi:hypothetical protein
MVGSDLDLNLDEFTGLRDLTATRQLEIVLGVDRIARINIDGVCVLRVRLKPGCQFDIRNDLNEAEA